jgi:hypothetical protein
MMKRREVVDGQVQWHDDDGLTTIWYVESTVLSDDAQQALGLVAYWAALLEQQIETALIELLFGLAHYERGRVMTRDLTAMAMIQRCKALVKLEATEDTAALEVLEKAATALQERNGVLHGAIGGHLSEGMLSVRNRKLGSISEASTADILNVAEVVFDAGMTVGNVSWHKIGTH